ncbi:MAG: Protein of unknown function (FYDLN_acid) [Alphaproteobacteria bacterium ADurb.Bin438]|nr:MAG: Protein of unknown function (FYDLN_acid) [Alphaproteobacteria bacterium ADurb.Bin438]
MAKPEWGKKRSCPACETRFYDLKAEEVKCPNCGHVVNPDEVWKMSKSALSKAMSKKGRKHDVDDIDDVLDEDDVDLSESVKDDDLDILEDASDLADDDSDMAEVVDTKITKGLE